MLGRLQAIAHARNRPASLPWFFSILTWLSRQLQNQHVYVKDSLGAGCCMLYAVEPVQVRSNSWTEIKLLRNKTLVMKALSSVYSAYLLRVNRATNPMG
ncbi:hypothetical protein KQX54_010472 [Cotesia glomerata]|uniref:Uncharacterized protein n=1 Tax=Cotesia glomerata TaxID=32391 RepID=A0AAV7J6S9_COTGL|nr:hypothetical protein KQX54_010472 [Cotesia glomerata]